MAVVNADILAFSFAAGHKSKNALRFARVLCHFFALILKYLRNGALHSAIPLPCADDKHKITSQAVLVSPVSISIWGDEAVSATA